MTSGGDCLALVIDRQQTRWNSVSRWNLAIAVETLEARVGRAFVMPMPPRTMRETAEACAGGAEEGELLFAVDTFFPR